MSNTKKVLDSNVDVRIVEQLATEIQMSLNYLGGTLNATKEETALVLFVLAEEMKEFYEAIGIMSAEEVDDLVIQAKSYVKTKIEALENTGTLQKLKKTHEKMSNQFKSVTKLDDEHEDQTPTPKVGNNEGN